MFVLKSLIKPSRLLSSVKSSPFSANIKDLEKALFTNLKSEIAAEEIDSERQKYIDDFLTQNNWTLEEEPNSTRLTLSKQATGISVKVYYEARLPDSANENQEDETKDEETNESNYTDFVVLVDKHKPQKMLLDVIAVDGEINLNGIVFSDEAEALAEKKTVQSSPYNGPAFETLDEKLQDRISKYVAGLGINEELAHFIEESAVHHEAKLYKKFLGEFKTFVE